MQLSEVVDQLEAVVKGLDPSCLSGSQAAEATGLFDRAERLSATGRALVAARAVECKQWTRSGARSPEEWLAGLSGVGTASAGRTLNTGSLLASQPELDAALRSGELSLVQAEEISAAAAKDPSATPRLIDKAKTRGLRGLKQECRRVELASRSAEDDRERAERVHRSRYLRTWCDRDGAGRIDARLAPDALARFLSALSPFQREAFEQARKSSVREPSHAYAADALISMAEAVVAGGGLPVAEDGKRRLPHKIVALIDHGALVRGFADGGEICEIQGIGPVPVSTIKAMAEDAFLAAVVTDGVDIRSVVHMGRHPNALQRTALEVRDKVCVVPGCEATQNLEADHYPPFEQTRHTTLDELRLVCSTHHDQITNRSATLTGGPGRWRWTPPPFHEGFQGPPSGWPEDAGPFDDPPPPAPIAGSSARAGPDPPV